jgi:hypothetical protein
MAGKRVTICVLVVALLAEASAFLLQPSINLNPSSKNLPSFRRAVAKCSSSLHVQARLEAVLFDCDGVLADTERDGHRVSFNRAFKEFGLKVGDKDMEWDVETYGKLLEIGGGKERMMGYWQEIGWNEGNWDLAKKLHERKTKIFSDLIAGGEIPLRAGVSRLVDEIFAGSPSSACMRLYTDH